MAKHKTTLHEQLSTADVRRDTLTDIACVQDKIEVEPERALCECVYEKRGHLEGEGECPYGPGATVPHPDGVVRRNAADEFLAAGKAVR